MKYFAVFVIAAYLIGLLFGKVSPRLRKGFLLVLCLLLTFAFYFLNKI